MATNYAHLKLSALLIMSCHRCFKWVFDPTSRANGCLSRHACVLCLSANVSVDCCTGRVINGPGCQGQMKVRGAQDKYLLERKGQVEINTFTDQLQSSFTKLPKQIGIQAKLGEEGACSTDCTVMISCAAC